MVKNFPTTTEPQTNRNGLLSVCKDLPPCTDEIGKEGLFMSNTEHNTLKVCEHCLMAIESREGNLPTLVHHLDFDDTKSQCDWCGETEIDTLYEIIV